MTAEPREMGNIESTISMSPSASDPDGDAITYSWSQGYGAAVSGRSGFDSATPSFTAPDSVDTLVFTVTATAGGQSDSAIVRVVVVEDTATTVFIDGTFTGTSDGSIDSPWSSLSPAVADSADAGDLSDFYIRILPNDDSYTLWSNLTEVRQLKAQSFYGGYDANWERDPVGNRTPVASKGRGFDLSDINSATTISGIALEVDAPDDDTFYFMLKGIWARSGTAPLIIENNSVVVNGPDGSFDNKCTEVLGVVLEDLSDAGLLDNIIEAGDGTLAFDQAPRPGKGADGADGGDARDDSNANGGDGGAQTGVGWNGGDGGEGGRTSFAGGDDGERGSGRLSLVVVGGGSPGSGGFYNTDNQTEGHGGDGGDCYCGHGWRQWSSVV